MLQNAPTVSTRRYSPITTGAGAGSIGNRFAERVRGFSAQRREGNPNNRTNKLWHLTPKFERLFRSMKIFDEDTTALFATGSATAVYGLAAVTLLGTLGIDTKPILAGAGITGATIGFAAKDVISNFMAGILTLANDRVKRGSDITVCGRRGVVERVDLSRLILRTESGDTVIIPSSKVLASDVVIHSKKIQ